MKFTTAVTSLGLIAGALAAPNTPAAALRSLKQRDAQIVHLTFHGGPASYDLTLYADGTIYPTNNALSVSTIDDNDFDALSMCTFHTAGAQTLVGSIDTQSGNQSIVVGPPQPITGVSCSGTCLEVYEDCYNNQGQYIGVCCNGYCAATKCRPWNDG